MNPLFDLLRRLGPAYNYGQPDILQGAGRLPGWAALGALTRPPFPLPPGQSMQYGEPTYPNGVPSFPAPAQRPSLLGRVFGGEDPGLGGLLDPEAQKKLGKAALLRAGLAALAASGSHPGPRTSLGEVIAQGLSAGQQAYGQGAQTMLGAKAAMNKQQMEAVRQQIYAKYQGKTDPQSLTAMMAELIGIGDVEAAKPISEYLKSIGGNANASRPFEVDRGDRVDLISPSGEVIGSYPKGVDPNRSREANDKMQAYRDELTTARKQQIENAMADDYRQFTNNVKIGAENYAQIQSTAKDAKAGDAAAQMSLIFSFMKMLDPGSTVREGEYATAENARGVAEDVRNQYNKVLKGQFLTPEQVDRFIGQSKRSVRAWKMKQDSAIKQFTARAKSRGLDPNVIVYDYFEGMDLESGSDRVRSLLNRGPKSQ